MKKERNKESIGLDFMDTWDNSSNYTDIWNNQELHLKNNNKYLYFINQKIKKRK